MASKHRDLLFSAIALGLVGVVIVGAAELFVRFIVDDGMQYDLEMWKYARSVKEIAPNPRIGHRHRPGSNARLMGVEVAINRHRLRGREVAIRQNAGVTRILMLGDSLTFGWGVPDDETVSRRVETALKKEGYDVQILNAGVGNYNTDMEVEYFLADGVKLAPNLIVLNYFINDAEPTPTYGNVGMISRNSYAFTYFGSRFDVLLRQLQGKKDWAAYYYDLYADVNPGKRAAARAIDQLAEYCRANSIGLMIVNYPELRDLKNYRFGMVQEFVRSATARNGVHYLDLFDSVRGEAEPSLWVTPEDPHPNGYANKFFADAISKALAREFLDRGTGVRDRESSRHSISCCGAHRFAVAGTVAVGAPSNPK